MKYSFLGRACSRVWPNKRAQSIVLLSTLALLLAPRPVSAQPEDPELADITGVVSTSSIRAPSQIEVEIVTTGLLDMTDSSGAFQFTDIPVGSIQIRFSRDDLLEQVIDVDLPESGVVLQIEMAAGATLEGHVGLQNPEDFLDGTIVRATDGVSVTTEADGSFDIELPAVGEETTIEFEREDYVTQLHNVNVVGQGRLDVDLRLDGSFGVGGLILGDGLPLENARIELSAPNQTTSREQYTESDGRFLIEDVPPGVYNLTVTRSGWNDRTVDPLELFDDQMVIVELEAVVHNDPSACRLAHNVDPRFVCPFMFFLAFWGLRLRRRKTHDIR